MEATVINEKLNSTCEASYSLRRLFHVELGEGYSLRFYLKGSSKRRQTRLCIKLYLLDQELKRTVYVQNNILGYYTFFYSRSGKRGDLDEFSVHITV